MTENQQKALENFKQFVEKDLNGKITEDFDIIPEVWQDNTINFWSKNQLTYIKATYNNGETQILITLNEEYLDQMIENFKEFVDNVDDDIFTEACDLFMESEEGNALVELDECLRNKSYYETPRLIKGFMECISKVARKKIESMIFKYFPEYKEFIKENGIEKISTPKDINDLD